MLLHELKLNHPRKYKKPRVGRGGKRGTFSGHGTKGQKSRAGHRIRPAERDFIQRLPKLRGLKNRPTSRKPQPVNLGDLEKKLNGAIINPKTLLEAGLIKDLKAPVKILGDGELKKALTFQGVAVSKKSREKIEAVGGKVMQ